MPQYVGSVYLDVRFDAAQAARSLQTSVTGAAQAGGQAMNAALSDRLLAFGTQATRVGRQLSFGLAAPLALLGKASEQAFVAYDTQMTKVAALTGVGAQQTAEWTDQVLAMGTAYGIAGEDAAAALYLITSSGLKGQQAISTLDVAMKASAVGMGDAKTMAGLLTSAMNAYGPANLSASRAADILTGAVKESKIPADELAGSLSQLLPFGAKLGVSFDQIAGAMAASSLTGTDAAKAATQLRGIFSALIGPAAAADKMLAGIGLRQKDLKKVLAEQGILPMLRTLQDAIVRSGAEADEGLNTMFGNVRALTGVFTLLNDQGGNIDRVLQNTAASAGALNKAWMITADTAGFQAKQATVALHNELIKLGQAVAPIATGFLKVAAAGVSFINALGPLKYALVGIGAFLAVLGPIAYSVGAISDVLGIQVKLLERLGIVGAKAGAEVAGGATAAAAAEGELAGAAEVAGAAVEQSTLFSTATMDALVLSTEAESEAMGQLALFGPVAMSGITAETAAATGAMEGLETVTVEETGLLATMGSAMMAALAPVAIVLAGLAAAAIIWNKRMQNATDDANALADVFANRIAGGGVEAANRTIASTVDQIRQLREEADQVHAPWDLDYRQELYAGAEALEAHVRAAQQDIDLSRRLAEQTGRNTDEIFQWLSSQRNAGTTFDTSTDALKAYTAAMAEHGETVSTAATASGRLTEEAQKLSDTFFGLQSAEGAYADSLQAITDAQHSAADAQRSIADARRDEIDAVAKVADAQQKYRDSIDRVTEAQRKLTDAQAKLNEELRGPTVGEALDVRQAQLSLQRAQQRLREPTKDPLERQQNQIDLQRAQIALQEAQGKHAENLADAQKDVASAQKDVTSAQAESRGALRGIADAQRGVEDAHRKVADAQDAEAKSQRDVTKAQDAALGAATNLATKQSDFADAIHNSNDDLGPFIKYLDDIRTRFPAVAGQVDAAAGRVGGLQDFFQQNTGTTPEAAGADQGKLYAQGVNDGIGNAPPPSTSSPWYQGVLGFFGQLGSDIIENSKRQSILSWVDDAQEQAPAKFAELKGAFDTGLNVLGTTVAEDATTWKNDILGWIDTARTEAPAKFAQLATAFARGLGVITGTVSGTAARWTRDILGWFDHAKDETPGKAAALGQTTQESLATVGPGITGIADGWKNNVLGWINTATVEGPGRFELLATSFATSLTTLGATISANTVTWKDNVLGWIDTAKTDGPNRLAGLTATFTTWAAGIPGAIVTAMGDLGLKLYGAGRQLMKGFFDAIHSVLDKLGAGFGILKEAFERGFADAFNEASSNEPPARAAGGPLAAGQLSTVNELGAPELWSAGGKQYLLPVAAGNVTPLHPAIDASVTNQPTLNAPITVYGADEPVKTAYEIRRQLRSKRDLVAH